MEKRDLEKTEQQYQGETAALMDQGEVGGSGLYAIARAICAAALYMGRETIVIKEADPRFVSIRRQDVETSLAAIHTANPESDEGTVRNQEAVKRMCRALDGPRPENAPGQV